MLLRKSKEMSVCKPTCELNVAPVYFCLQIFFFIIPPEIILYSVKLQLRGDRSVFTFMTFTFLSCQNETNQVEMTEIRSLTCALRGFTPLPLIFFFTQD